MTCQAPMPTQQDLLDLDYYYLPDSLQIQGRARLPKVVERFEQLDESHKKMDPLTQLDRRYLSLTERRKICLEKALVNAHSKWLNITEYKWLPQSEWILRLRLKHKGVWYSCLQEAKVIDHFYDLPGECRLVVRYGCDPEDY